MLPICRVDSLLTEKEGVCVLTEQSVGCYVTYYCKGTIQLSVSANDLFLKYCSTNKVHVAQCCNFFLVANRCIPTGVDLINQARDVFNFTSSEGLMNLTNATDDVNFEDLILNVNIQDIVDGNL